MFRTELPLTESHRMRSFPGGRGTLKQKERAQEGESSGYVRERASRLGCCGGVLTLKPGCTLESPGQLLKLPLPRLHQLNRISGADF